ncbi:SCO family protein [Leptolyngbya sp. 7M]|uniref:SCO family protein n=1 Tax=Leptolyngbya sp. 7M TaxID=2812896 RepID=UPI001B8D6C24|nr:SCO family protein [Leptolyngbya sp. 7M]QYO67144.1 SCO family protein [Leptolyngbya sp. 7M]
MQFRLLLLVALLCLAISACSSGHDHASESPDAARYELRGRVISVDRATKTAQIEHEEIPGFMPRMTMDFKINEDWLWDDLLPGVEIQGTLVYDKNAPDPMRLERVAISAAPNPNLPQPEPKTPRQIGQEPPDIPLTNQDGKRISFKDFRGKTLAVTFIYRECPLPEYCIKMSQNFSDAAMKIAASEEYRKDLRLLSISFDPARDTPAKLREYGLGYLGNPEKPDFTVWQIAVGPDKDVRKIADFFGLKYEVDVEDKTQFTHSLVTAIIGPDGKVTRMLPGNRWSPDQLLIDMRQAADTNQAKE